MTSKAEAFEEIREIELPAGTYKINGEEREVCHTFIVRAALEQAEGVDVEGAVSQTDFLNAPVCYQGKCCYETRHRTINHLTAQGYLRTPEAQNNPRECSDDLVSLSSEAGAPAAPVDAQGGVSATEKDRVIEAAQDYVERYVAGLATGSSFARLNQALAEYQKIGGGDD